LLLLRINCLVSTILKIRNEFKDLLYLIIEYSTAFRFAVDKNKMTLTPLSSSVDTVAIGSQSKLSSGDVQALTKSYSCAGRVATFGGGNALVSFIHVYNSSKIKSYIYMFSTIFTVFLLGISYFQGCGGTLNGTIPSSGTLQWTIIPADQMNVLVIFSDWTVSITTQN